MAELRDILGNSNNSENMFSGVAGHDNRIHLWFNPQANKIDAIKLLREITGLYLKDAKDAVESRDGFTITKLVYEKLCGYKTCVDYVNGGKYQIQCFINYDPHTHNYKPIQIWL